MRVISSVILLKAKLDETLKTPVKKLLVSSLQDLAGCSLKDVMESLWLQREDALMKWALNVCKLRLGLSEDSHEGKQECRDRPQQQDWGRLPAGLWMKTANPGWTVAYVHEDLQPVFGMTMQLATKGDTEKVKVLGPQKQTARRSPWSRELQRPWLRLLLPP